ncbi:uncharacterized protein C4orf19 homolog [Pantherophis guttatus]|uniref:Uncharacterized protein C4orf19 homolog n=1 Tax=Pantherophis guttatus TaxID=94885 RepID=A0ABM3ZEK3_PANGU|nr:uncharacterized protein C4orf19 homolog [Pantherophis guttatus]
MGCKCCKMIKSYIFHPQDVQTAAYINEINNCKSDEEEERGRFHFKQSSNILDRRNEVQIAEMPVASNQCRFHYSKDALWSSRIPAVPDKRLGNAVVKCNVNGIHSSKNIGASPHKTQPKEINLHSSSAQQPDPPGKRVFQPKTGDKLKIFDPENQPKQTSNALCEEEGPRTTAEPIFSIPCALPEIRHKVLRLDNPSFLPEDNHAEKSRAVGKENLSNHLVQINQNTGNTTIVHNRNPPCGESDEGDGVWRTSPFGFLFEDQISTEILSGRKKGESAWEARCDGLTKVNGELEEDAEVAEALAALEAATAGEIFEEEEEEEDY